MECEIKKTLSAEFKACESHPRFGTVEIEITHDGVQVSDWADDVACFTHDEWDRLVKMVEQMRAEL